MKESVISKSCRWIKGNYDIIFAIILLISIFTAFLPDNLVCKFLKIVSVLIGFLIGICYYGYAIYLWFGNKVHFDWHLINGKFLRKVVCVVLATPFVFTFILGLCDYDTNKRFLLYQDGVFKENSEKPENGINEAQKDPTLFWIVYYHFIDPGNQHISTSSQGRSWVALIAVAGVFLLNGLLVSSIISWLDKRKERWEKGMEPYKSFLKRRKHYVIIGGSDMVGEIVEQIFEKENKKISRLPYVLIQTSSDVEQFRHKLFSMFDTEQQKNIIICYGNRNVKQDIEQLQLHKAIEVYILGEESRTDDMESYHDTMNMKCLDLVCEKIKDESKYEVIKDSDNKVKEDNRLVVRLMFEYQTTFNVFQYSEISDRIEERINFKPFYYYEMWAQRVLVNKELKPEAKHEYLPLEGVNGIKKDDSNYVHLVVVGMTRMGTALATQAALMAHYPNFVTKGKRTKITLIDEDADKEKSFYIDRYDRLFALSNWSYKEMVRAKDGKEELETIHTHTPSGVDYLGGDFLDVEWEFIKGSMSQLKLQDYIKKYANKTEKLTVAICKDEPSICVATALNMDWEIYKNALQVLVYNRYDDALIKAISPTENSKFFSPFGDKLKAFGMAAKCYSDDILQNSEFVGGKIGEVYENTRKRLQECKPEINLTDVKGKSLMSKYWSNIYSANTLWTKLRCVDRSDNKIESEDIDILAKVEHNRWNIEQLLMSYRHLSFEEQKDASENPVKKEKQKGDMAHLNICSNEKLKEIDKEAIEYDKDIASELLKIYNDFIEWKTAKQRND